MFATLFARSAWELAKRAEETDPDGDPDQPAKNEINSSWALFMVIMLLVVAFFTSYTMQQRKITAVHETVISIFAGMTVGLILRIAGVEAIRDILSFDYQIFFNILLPPIILSSGYELHQANFFRNISTILTFAFAGTFISAVVIGVLLWLYAILPVEQITLSWIDAISVGATLSATDPVTILAIFNSYKVDPKLYTIIFGESILNDAIAIVIFESAQNADNGGKIGVWSLFNGVWFFLSEFFGSLLIGAAVGIMVALGLKYTYVRRYPNTESCLVLLIAYGTYYFSQAVKMSGIVSLLFCGITLKHYAYFNMSRRTQLTTKYMLQVLAQLTENFIFIYLGLSLFTDTKLVYRPLFIIVTVMAVCVARWMAVFPLSWAINWFIRYRARRQGKEASDELPFNYQAMLFWAGLRGAVGVALAASLKGKDDAALKATVLVVVVLTVIIFGGTTARMLEIQGIRTGVVEEVDSDDEFDIEAVGGGLFKRADTGIGYNPRSRSRGSALPLGAINGSRAGSRSRNGWASGHRSPNVPRPGSRSRKDLRNDADELERSELLGALGNNTDSEIGSDIDTSDLPPPAPRRRSSPMPPGATGAAVSSGESYVGGSLVQPAAEGVPPLTASAAIRQLFSTEDPSALFRQLDEDYIKPKLLLDGSNGRNGGSGSH
ncbi:putative sodium/hydrogen exchanger protein [Lasiosphaeria miniovina]|uniref:Sodium/hydrogen exchanger n=1 Tax=Lasiosphaeria miniovina TaxID=1954250 RepID=A0AA40DZQ9_9PEZI|nr:putative sodium/hydrogen exchanger protein [Lasiosphaeria miniovina]KAK0722569.1 putative sodium/hydrogen exchanger protein [Lasiosphaeria miniovina]